MRKRGVVLLIASLLLGLAAGGGCGTGSTDSPPANTGASNDDQDGGSFTVGDASLQTLVVQPQTPTLEVSAPGTTLAFKALLGGVAVSAQWTIDAAGVGTIDAKGLFTATGNVGGIVGVTAQTGGKTASTRLTVRLHLNDNSGNVDSATQTLLEGGGNADAAFRWLYPYDATVFPRDVPSPSLQLDGPPFDAAYVHVTSGTLEYKGFFGTSSPPRILLSPATWRAIATSSAGVGPVKIEITKAAGGEVTGPLAETWTIAPGNLRGSIYYNSYNSIIANNAGAVLRLRPGGVPSVVIPTNPNGECHVCHVVSADGTTMVASNEIVAPTPGFNVTDGVYDLTQNGTKVNDVENRTWLFGALYPDGSRFLQFGSVPDLGAPGMGWAPNVRGLGQPVPAQNGKPAETGDRASLLFDPKTGAPIAAPGLDGENLHMMMPTFSPDGKMVAFNHFDTGQGHTIAVMNFDPKTNTFSGLRDVATLPTSLLGGWPAFTPDDKYVFFAGGTNPEYDTFSDDPSVVPQPASDIYIASVASSTYVAADNLNGVSQGKVVLPFGEAAEGHQSFEPTILPVAAGGYYWVVFTSRREYGNTIGGDPWSGPGGAPSPRKKLWVAAIDIDSGEIQPSAPRDATHPAFYLDGQELTPGNMRAFWALDPCDQNGVSCETGDACCSGFCRQSTGADGGATFRCVAPDGCANESEKCATAADCCDTGRGAQCINGFCALPGPR